MNNNEVVKCEINATEIQESIKDFLDKEGFKPDSDSAESTNQETGTPVLRFNFNKGGQELAEKAMKRVIKFGLPKPSIFKSILVFPDITKCVPVRLDTPHKGDLLSRDLTKEVYETVIKSPRIQTRVVYGDGFIRAQSVDTAKQVVNILKTLPILPATHHVERKKEDVFLVKSEHTAKQDPVVKKIVEFLEQGFDLEMGEGIVDAGRNPAYTGYILVVFAEAETRDRVLASIGGDNTIQCRVSGPASLLVKEEKSLGAYSVEDLLTVFDLLEGKKIQKTKAAMPPEALNEDKISDEKLKEIFFTIEKGEDFTKARESLGLTRVTCWAGDSVVIRRYAPSKGTPGPTLDEVKAVYELAGATVETYSNKAKRYNKGFSIRFEKEAILTLAKGEAITVLEKISDSNPKAAENTPLKTSGKQNPAGNQSTKLLREVSDTTSLKDLHSRLGLAKHILYAHKDGVTRIVFAKTGRYLPKIESMEKAFQPLGFEVEKTQTKAKGKEKNAYKLSISTEKLQELAISLGINTSGNEVSAPEKIGLVGQFTEAWKTTGMAEIAQKLGYFARTYSETANGSIKRTICRSKKPGCVHAPMDEVKDAFAKFGLTEISIAYASDNKTERGYHMVFPGDVVRALYKDEPIRQAQTTQASPAPVAAPSPAPVAPVSVSGNVFPITLTDDQVVGILTQAMSGSSRASLIEKLLSQLDESEVTELVKERLSDDSFKKTVESLVSEGASFKTEDEAKELLSKIADQHGTIAFGKLYAEILIDRS